MNSVGVCECKWAREGEQVEKKGTGPSGPGVQECRNAKAYWKYENMKIFFIFSVFPHFCPFWKKTVMCHLLTYYLVSDNAADSLLCSSVPLHCLCLCAVEQWNGALQNTRTYLYSPAAGEKPLTDKCDHPLTSSKSDTHFISNHQCCRLGVFEWNPLHPSHTHSHTTATGIVSAKHTKVYCKTLASLCLQRHSAVSLRNITTEVLKVLNTTEELLHGVEGGSALATNTLPPNTDPKKLDEHYSKLEENVGLTHTLCFMWVLLQKTWPQRTKNALLTWHRIMLVNEL